MMLSTPEATASSTPYWMIGLSTSGSISLGCALVAGRNRVPSPAAGKTGFAHDSRVSVADLKQASVDRIGPDANRDKGQDQPVHATI